MEREKQKAILESILFAMGESVEISRLAHVIDEDVRVTKSLLKEMEESYKAEERGIELTYFEDAVSFVQSRICTNIW